MAVQPAAQLCTRGPQHPCADGDDLPVRLGKADEAIRTQAPARRVLPTQQRLESHDRSTLERHERLVIEDELVASEDRGELAAELEVLECVLMHRRREGGDPRLSLV